MWVIAGLGNPGAEYAQTRHNLGFMVVETLARRWHIQLCDVSGDVRVGSGRIADRAVQLAEPRAFMNRSGEALAQLPLKADDALMVIHDDLDLPAGQLRVRPRGGSGGHRGVGSIVDHFGSEFTRIRVGIGRPLDAHDPVDYVLAPLSPAELLDVRASVERACNAVECVVIDGTAVAMNRFNMRPTASEER